MNAERAALLPETLPIGNKIIFVCIVLSVACATRRSANVFGSDSGSSGPDGPPPAPSIVGCEVSADADRDGIADRADSEDDPDGDGIPARLDTDSDGDGINDSAENEGGAPCRPRDSDADAVPDHLDGDSDNDGVDDIVELDAGTNTRKADTDDDGIPDLVERAAGTNPVDATSTIDESDFYVVLPFNGSPVRRSLRFGTSLKMADVFFLVDMTGSMGGVRRVLIDRLADTIVPGIAAAISDVQIGVGGYDDYPVREFGRAPDMPFYLLRKIGPVNEDRGSWSVMLSAELPPSPFGAATSGCPLDRARNDIGDITDSPNGVPDLIEAIRGLPCHNGGDEPESTGPALFATATGLGLTWPTGAIPDQSCEVIPDEVGTRFGYPCFRPGALPIILVFGDRPWHNGMGMRDEYDFAAPSFDNTIAALDNAGARVISIVNIGEGGSIPTDYSEVARATGTVRADGTPLSFTIDTTGRGLDRTVVDAVASLASSVPQDVSTRTENGNDNPGNFDATQFITAIRPVEGYRGTVSGAMPGITYREKNETTFIEVIPGTDVEFEVTFHNTVRPSESRVQVFRAQIGVIGNGVTRLETRNVYVVVPGNGGILVI